MCQLELDKANQQKQNSVIDRLTVRLKSYKRQADESEEMAAENLDKFQKARSQLAQVEHHMEQSETLDLKMRVYSRSSISCTRSTASAARDLLSKERSHARAFSKSGSTFNLSKYS